MPTKEDIIKDILSKKELADIELSFVAAILEKELRKNQKIAKELDKISIRSEAYKKLIKNVRSVLRRNVSLFEGNPKHAEALLAELRQSSQKEEVIEHLLSTHASTKERLLFNSEVYEKIFAIIEEQPKTVLDIGCGLNPLSFPLRDTTYIGVDIDRKLCVAVGEYFSIMGIEGECRVFDAKNIEKIKKLPESDIAFVFKLVDLLDQTGHKTSESLIKALPARFVVVSFATLTSAGNPMTSPRRPWIEKMLERLKYKYALFKIPNEIFYVIQK